MASLSEDQIAQIISMTGGDTSMLVDAGVSTGQIIRTLINKPEVLSKLQKSAGRNVTGFGRFYKEKVYDPAYELNDTEAKYRNMNPSIAKFATDFWSKIREQGSDTTSFNYVKDTYDKNRGAVEANFGMTSDQYDDVMAMIDNDIDSFRKNEVTRQRKQYTAWTNKRKAMGITSRETAAGDYLKTKTGIAGLADVPASLEDFAKSKASGFSDYAKKQGLKDADIAGLLPQLEGAIKKKVGKNYKNYALQDLLKRQVTGE